MGRPNLGYLSAYAAALDSQREWRKAGRRALEAQRRMYEQHKTIPQPKLAHPSACENCGSSEYQHHHGRLICSYCRSAP